MSPSVQTARPAIPSKRLGGVFWILAIIVVAGGGVLWITQRSTPPSSPAPAGQAKSTLHLETFVINLADLQQRSYLRVGIDLGLNHEIGRGEQAPAVAPARDVILSVLAQASVEELLTTKGKASLKQSVLSALQERLPGLGVEEVYFTEFLIQR
jgi:flagellar basal body-associated protein FliL